jgi:hypothetical protein
MAGTTCLALLFPSSEWEVMWRLNLEAHSAFQAMGSWAILLMFSVATACAMAATGLWILARWGQRLAITILLVNMASDMGNAIVRGDLRTLIGIPIAAAMIWDLLTPGISRSFVAKNVAP